MYYVNCTICTSIYLTNITYYINNTNITIYHPSSTNTSTTIFSATTLRKPHHLSVTLSTNTIIKEHMYVQTVAWKICTSRTEIPQPPQGASIISFIYTVINQGWKITQKGYHWLINIIVVTVITTTCIVIPLFIYWISMWLSSIQSTIFFVRVKTTINLTQILHIIFILINLYINTTTIENTVGSWIGC